MPDLTDEQLNLRYNSSFGGVNYENFSQVPRYYSDTIKSRMRSAKKVFKDRLSEYEAERAQEGGDNLFAHIPWPVALGAVGLGVGTTYYWNKWRQQAQEIAKKNAEEVARQQAPRQQAQGVSAAGAPAPGAAPAAPAPAATAAKAKHTGVRRRIAETPSPVSGNLSSISIEKMLEGQIGGKHLAVPLSDDELILLKNREKTDNMEKRIDDLADEIKKITERNKGLKKNSLLEYFNKLKNSKTGKFFGKIFKRASPEVELLYDDDFVLYLLKKNELNKEAAIIDLNKVKSVLGNFFRKSEPVMYRGPKIQRIVSSGMDQQKADAIKNAYLQFLKQKGREIPQSITSITPNKVEGVLAARRG